MACLPRPLLTCSAVTTASAPRCIRTPPPTWGEGRPASRHPRYSRPDRMTSSATQTRQLSPLSALPISYTCVACANTARPMPGRYRSGNLGGRTACAAVERAAARRRGEPAAGAGGGGGRDRRTICSGGAVRCTSAADNAAPATVHVCSIFVSPALGEVSRACFSH